MKKILKIAAITLSVILGIISIVAVCMLGYFYFSTNNVKLDISKLDGNYCNIQIFDGKNTEIPIKNSKYVKYEDVSPYIIDTFVSVEDKRFFKHKGIDMTRMASAAVKNIASKSLKEGASTITQQLIKNTHLSNDKTFKRKLAEIRLAIKLEKQLSKKEIMEKYLNNIYFGSGIYGVHDACKAFFDKEPSEVNLSEATIIVGVVKNPSKNSPITNLEGAKARQKVILSVLSNNKTFDENLINQAKNNDIILKNGLIHNKMYKSFLNNAIYESSAILGIEEKQLANEGYRIVTYLDSALQKSMYEQMTSYDVNYDYVRASIDNKNMGVTSYVSNISQVDSKINRQVGSLIKPFSVYLPCYENKLIFPKSQILDEKININGYSPSNFNNVYHGYVSVEDSIAHSYNVPAVKLLNQLGVNTSVDFLSRYNMKISDNCKNLSLALGTNSTSPLKIASCYSSIANGGIYTEAKFVKQIIDNDGNILYSNKENKNRVVDSDVNYLMLDNLIGVSKYGTGKKLKDLPYQIACKTGTVANSHGDNIDAWCCATTTEDTFIAWDGARIGEILDKNHGGSSYPTMSVKDYAEFVYQDSLPSDFEKPKSILRLPVNADLLESEHIVQSVPQDFSGNVVYGFFSENNLPDMTTLEINFEVQNYLFEDIIQFRGETGKKYNIYQVDGHNKTLIQSVMCNGDFVKLIRRKNNLFKHYDYYVEFVQE